MDNPAKASHPPSLRLGARHDMLFRTDIRPINAVPDAETRGRKTNRPRYFLVTVETDGNDCPVRNFFLPSHL
jgi:hypothetical protein